MPRKETRKKARKISTLDKLRKKVPAGNLKFIDAAAVLAATRRRDYSQMEEHRRHLGDFIKRATEEYRVVEKHMKAIEEEEFHKMMVQVDKPKSSWW